ncbi:hypothetical protein TBK1r_43550 [Stieleria magnilauensis]|uniref:Transposase n=1 Tax=Stieleria magnilauensis TaxID=2527963 RepID=A0ABX5XWP5_9BACT|nr:hypothetical protein TBK1r_43550 [Planctomycetes bacterium TBK1r]
MINAWVGLSTDEMRRRYRHLFLSKEQKALEIAFGYAEDATA